MSKLLINEQPLQVLPSLANIIGLNEAIILQQLHFFLRISRNKIGGRSWVYNTINDWQAEFSFWSVKTVQRTIDNLEKSGLVVSTDKFNKMKMDKTKWYTIDYQKLSEILPENEKTPFGQNDQMETPKKENAFGQNDQMETPKKENAFGQNDQMTFGQNDQSNNQRNKNINITPLSPYGESANAEHSEVGGADKPHTDKKQNSIKVNYSVVAETYNDLVKELNSNLPLIANPSQLSDKRKKAIKKLAQVFIKRFDIDNDVESALGEYFKDFLKSATSFYFGENNRGWKADFEYILRETTLDKVLEGNW